MARFTCIHELTEFRLFAVRNFDEV